MFRCFNYCADQLCIQIYAVSLLVIKIYIYIITSTITAWCLVEPSYSRVQVARRYAVTHALVDLRYSLQ